MPKNYLEQEIGSVIAQLQGFFVAEGLKKHFSYETELAQSATDVEVSHQYLSEMSRFLHDGHVLAIPSLPDMDPLFLSLSQGSVLSVAELYSVLDVLSCSSDLYDLLADKKEYFHLNDDALDLNPLEALKRDLQTSLEPDLTVSDQASAKLREVRNERRGLERTLSNIMTTYKSRYASYLSADVITLKGGEEALPVKTSQKSFVKGTVVAYSSSGETAFMVPYEVLDLRSKLSSVMQEEATEVMKVLADLSQKATKQLKYLTTDYEIILRLDRYYGAVVYGNTYQGTIAELSQKELAVKGLFHPLLHASKIIPNSLILGDSAPKALLITGPNAGGKSVLIKALALAVTMDKLGLLVPCRDGAKIPYIDQVYFQDGDNQSVADNLSTFSSHLIGIKEITEKATPSSLVIIDEVGEGTSPSDGEALGVAILKYFEKLNCFTLITSHFDGLKIYAAKDPLAMMGAMEFDNDSLTPTYRLLLHASGKSYGILLAKNLGLKPEIISDAETFEASRSDKDTDALLEKLTEQASWNEKRARDLEASQKNLDAMIGQRQAAIDSLNKEKQAIAQNAEEKIEKIVDQRINEIDRVWKTKETSASYSDVSKAKGELNKMRDAPAPILVGKGDSTPLLKEGDWVEDEDGRKANVLEVRKKDVTIDIDGLRFTRPLKGLKKVPSPQKPLRKGCVYTSADTAYLNLGPSQGLELNIIGLHVDDAMRKVVSFLGSARIRKFGTVRIIHGAGSFALKNAVWKYLGNHPEFVKDYRLGGQGEGGLGATVIHLV